jgi:hypothetical protein
MLRTAQSSGALDAVQVNADAWMAMLQGSADSSVP